MVLGFLATPQAVHASLDGEALGRWPLASLGGPLRLYLRLAPSCSAKLRLGRAELLHSPGAAAPAAGTWTSWAEQLSPAPLPGPSAGPTMDLAGALVARLVAHADAAEEQGQAERPLAMSPGAGLVARLWGMLAELSRGSVCGQPLDSAASEAGLAVRRQVVAPLLRLLAAHGAGAKLAPRLREETCAELVAMAELDDPIVSPEAIHAIKAIFAIFYPCSQFCEINISLLSL